MLQGWIVIAAVLFYFGALFAIASYGDRQAKLEPRSPRRPFIYALSLAVYCTSWTFFGSVGLAAGTGYDFLTIYIGAGFMVGVGYPLIQRIVSISKSQNITTIADFIAARYGKNTFLAALVTVIAVIGIVPYISLQLKAIAGSIKTILASANEQVIISAPGLETTHVIDLALPVALTLALFAILFGTRHIDATEHQDGLVLAIATESVVKLLAFLFVGGFVTFWMFDGPEALYTQAMTSPEIAKLFEHDHDVGKWLVMSFLSLVCIILLPRQFHMSVVENNSLSDIRQAAWLFPLYLVAINIFVIPIAVAGLLTFPAGTVNADMFVLALPMAADAKIVTLIAFVGGLSAATAMVIVASVALAIMVCNDLVIPFLLRRGKGIGPEQVSMGPVLLNIRRTAIFAILLLAYAYNYLMDNDAALASIGLLSFAATAQFAPAFFGGLIWKRANARGAIAGIVVGFSVWVYTLLFPSFVQSGWMSPDLLQSGPLGIEWLRPQSLFGSGMIGDGIDPLTHGVLWSVFLNIAAYITISLSRAPEAIERLQANLFTGPDQISSRPPFRHRRATIGVGDLRDLVVRYLGKQRAARSFREYEIHRDIELDDKEAAEPHLIRFTEHLLASAIGAASSRLVMSLLIQRSNVGNKAAIKLLDDASEAIQYNRDLLQTALDHVGQGICVFDPEMRLNCWNRQFRELLELPSELGRVGVSLQEIIQHNVAQGLYAETNIEDIVSDRINRLVVTSETYHERLSSGTVLEVRTASMPDGGIVTTFTDITESVESKEALAKSNETLERRVNERTEELTQLNQELVRARAEAEQANLGKTRFLAAASHDILQPLNAARLYTTGLVERDETENSNSIARNIDASLESVEEILGTLLDISRLDTGALKPELSVFDLDQLLNQMAIEFQPMAQEKGIKLGLVPSSVAVRSDRRMLSRILQNFISNAIKYSSSGRILVGCRREGNNISIEVHDTGMGIPASKQKLIFKEFHRIVDSSANDVKGLGLGLSIVERMGRVLGHPISVKSTPEQGSVFSIKVPMSTALPGSMTTPRISTMPMQHLDDMNVLCIDNEERILNGMEILLGGWGCNVIKAKDLASALEAVKQSSKTPDILLVDYHLDNSNGLDTISGFRWKLGRDLPAILITADRSPGLRREAREKQIPVLNKPVKPAALRALLARHRVQRIAAE